MEFQAYNAKMLIPIGTNVENKRYPTITYCLIGLNLLIFALQWSIQRSGDLDAQNGVTRWIGHVLIFKPFRIQQGSLIPFVCYCRGMQR